MKNVVIAITVRSSSSRLSKKAFLKIGNKSIIEWCIDNCKKSEIKNNSIVITTTSKKEDQRFRKIAKKKISFFAGSEKNIVNRMLKLLEKKKAKYVIRVTGDSPLIDPKLINFLIKKTNQNYDFIYFNDGPLGIKPELLSRKGLVKLNRYDNTRDCEYLSLFYKNNPNYFKIKNEKFYIKKNFKKLRLNIDYKEDLLLHNKLFNKLQSSNYNLENILKLFVKKKELFKINSNIQPVYRKGKFATRLKYITTLSK